MSLTHNEDPKQGKCGGGGDVCSVCGVCSGGCGGGGGGGRGGDIEEERAFESRCSNYSCTSSHQQGYSESTHQRSVSMQRRPVYFAASPQATTEMSVRLSFCLSICLPVYTCLHGLSVLLLIPDLSACLSICPYMRLAGYLPIYMH